MHIRGDRVLKTVVETGQLYDKNFFANQQDGAYRSAEIVVPLLLEILGPLGSVIDVGCGTGAWLSVFQRHGVAQVFGVDGDYVDRQMLYVPRDCFGARDLFQPIDDSGPYDLACTLEVAEHLPAERAESFVDDLARLSSVVCFSAAIPGQGGTHHINERWPDYWAKLFAARGFYPVDLIRPRIWRDNRIEWWYCQNILLFATEPAIRANRTLAAGRKGTRDAQLSLVHPRRFQISQRIIAKQAERLRGQSDRI